MTRITSDVDAMEQSVLQGLTSLLEEFVTFLVVATMVIWISPLVGMRAKKDIRHIPVTVIRHINTCLMTCARWAERSRRHMLRNLPSGVRAWMWRSSS